MGLEKHERKNQMKKLILILIACLLTQIANARPPQLPNRFLTDLTPGGFYEPDADHWPDAFVQFLDDIINGDLLFFDEMFAVPYVINGQTYPPGWVCQFGILCGGTYFSCYIDRTGPVPVAVIRWDFTGSNYVLDRIYIHNDDTDFTTLYQVRTAFGNRGMGMVTIHHSRLIDEIAFYGKIR